MQCNAFWHAADVVVQCSGAAFDEFQAYAATVYTGYPHGGTGSLQGLKEGARNTNFLLSKDDNEFHKYREALSNPANHAQYLEVDTPDTATVGYWDFLLVKNNISKSKVRYVP